MASDYKPFTRLDLTYKLENYPSHTPLSNDKIDSAIKGAFAKWQAVSPFTFSKTTSNSPDIKLSFGSVKDSKDHAETDRTVHSIVFNDERTWLDLADELRAKNTTTGVLAGVFVVASILVRGIWDGVDGLDINRPDVLSVAVHEIGHALGLAHNPAAASLMQPTADYYKMTNVNGAPIPQVDIDALKEANRHLFSAYYASHGITGWFKRGDGFVQVSAGLDNTVWAIDKEGRAREFSPAESGRDDHWDGRGGNMLQVAVFSAGMVLGVTKNNELKAYNPPPLYRPQDHQYWLDVAKAVSFVAIGANGALWAVAAADGKSFRHRGFFSGLSERLETLQSDWGPATGQFRSLAVGRIAPGETAQVVGGEKVLGLDWAFSMPLQHDHYNNRWDQIGPPQNSAINVGDDGTVVRLNNQGELYRYDGRSSWTKLPQPGALRNISVVSKTNMWAVGTNGEIYSTIA